MLKSKLNKKLKKDVVILATKESHVLGDLLIRYVAGELNANIKAVIANHETLRSLVENLIFHLLVLVLKEWIELSMKINDY